MKDLESNKIIAAVLLAGLIGMISGKLADIFYSPDLAPKKRGYAIEVPDESTVSSTKKEEEVIDIASLMASADQLKGAKVAKKCVSCHSFNEGGPNKVGPNLWNVINQPIAKKPDYPYSDALASIGKNWTYDEMFAFLKGPKQYAPGTKMGFAGLRKPKDIANLIAYMETHSPQ